MTEPFKSVESLQKEVLEVGKSVNPLKLSDLRASMDDVYFEAENINVGAQSLNNVAERVIRFLPKGWYERWNFGKDNSFWDDAFKKTVASAKEYFGKFSDDDKSKLLHATSWLIAGKELMNREASRNANDVSLREDVSALRDEIVNHRETGEYNFEDIRDRVIYAQAEIRGVFGVDRENIDTLKTAFGAALGSGWFQRWENKNDGKMWEEAIEASLKDIGSDYLYLNKPNLVVLMKRLSWVMVGEKIMERIKEERRQNDEVDLSEFKAQSIFFRDDEKPKRSPKVK